jgi:hypothetical protein
MRLRPRFAFVVLVASALTACERKPAPRPVDTQAAVTQPDTTSTAAVPPLPPARWDSSAGPVLVIRGNSPTEASVVFPAIDDSVQPDTVRFDDARVRGATLDLFDRSGLVGEARAGGISGDEWSGDRCTEWPATTVQGTGPAAPPASWTVGFVHGRVLPVRLDSIETLSRTDSARLAADITRLVSALPGDTSRTFRGIPFAVRTAYRFSAAPGVEGIVADVVRKLNQEANPLEQHTLVIAERDSASTSGQYHVVYTERTAGSEESLETSDVLAAVSLGTPRHTALVLLREGYESTAYALLERMPDGHWRVRWTSAHTGC